MSDLFGADLIVLHSAGLANIVCFRCGAAKSLRLIDEDDDDIDVILNRIAKKVRSEVKGINLDKNHYSTIINKDIAMNEVSETLIALLGLVSAKLDMTFFSHNDGINRVQDAVQKGFEQMCEFGENLPDGLHETIHKTVTTMVATKKHVNVGGSKVYDMNIIYSRVIGQQSSGRDVDIKDVLSYELAPVPTSMFDPTGEMRAATSKSSLKRQLLVEVSARTSESETSVVVIDGSALLWVVPWPAEGTTTDYANNFKHVIAKRLEVGDVHLVFDRYYDYSTKSVTRSARATGASRVHELQLNTKLPPQKTVLTVTENKKQLINLIVKLLIEDESQILVM